MAVTPVVLCGGAGTRLWPLSRKKHAKQFVPIIDECSLFQKTLERIQGPAFEEPIILTSQDSRFLVSEQLRQIGSHAQILLEPEGRDTLGAIAVAAEFAEQRQADSTLLILPSDHQITDKASFATSVLDAASAASKGKIVTFGIKPSHPACGYGYIKPGEAKGGVQKISAFIEKPSRKQAESLIAEGYLWNSGMFCFQCTTLLTELERLEPKTLQGAKAALCEAEIDLGYLRLGPGFKGCRKVSFDYAIMENTTNGAVLPVDYSWSDVGSWEEIWRISEKDESGNAISGDVALQHTSNSLVKSTSRLVVTLDVENLVVIDTPDALIVAKMDAAPQIKDVVKLLTDSDREEVETPAKIFRPWGWYQTVDVGERFKVKRIAVMPGKKLSLQKHAHRAEHWVVVRGTATTTIGDITRDVHENESIYVPIGSPHRLSNTGKIPLEIVEIQTGTYLEEDDILRLDDDFGRD